MKFTTEQRKKILDELNPENKDGILSRLMEDIRRVFRGLRTVLGEQSRPYILNVEELRELVKDIGKFDRDAYDIHNSWIDPDGCCGELLDEYKLWEPEGDCYFDFDRDVACIRKTIMTHALFAAAESFYIDLSKVYEDLRDRSERYMEYDLGVMPGYYYYEKDHYGKEKCYYMGKGLESAQSETLHYITDKFGFPLRYVIEGEWDYMKNADETEPKIKARNNAFRTALEKGIEFPMTLISHCTDNIEEKYEAVDFVDYDALIEEYTKILDYQIAPCYIKGTKITREEAIEKGMYALAKEIEMNELKQEDADEQRNAD